MKKFNPNKDLPEIQGNILRSHGRKNVRCLFLQFNGTGDENTNQIRLKISELAHGVNGLKITTAAEQRINSEAYKKAKDEGSKDFIEKLNFCFYLTAEGYDRLEINGKPNDFSFLNGMTYIHNRKFLGDNIEEWEDFYKQEERKIDAMILLAHNEPPALSDAILDIKKHFENLVDITIQEGAKLFNNKDEPVEVFGFRDSLSQPPFWDRDPKNKYKKNLRTRNLRLILTEDPITGYGSFLVFRKIQQFRTVFEKEILKIAEGLFGKNPTSQDIKNVEALVIGRYKDGSLLLPKNVTKGLTRAEIHQQYNNYETGDQKGDFKHDPHGTVCPFHSHIRKVNPRDSNAQILKKIFYRGAPDKNVELRMIRAGIPYKDSDQNEGLLFMSFQASILNQFVPMHKMWVNKKSFPNGITGVDPIIGCTERNSLYQYQWKWGNKTFAGSFKKPTKVLGGEFFFAPSIPFLQNIDKI